MPTVSVILTSYNHEKYIRESIDSILSQTYADFELVIVDDCSTDASWKIIESFSDERIIKIRNQQNILFYAENTIVNVARGKYIAIQHSDDIWEPDKLRKQVSFLAAHPECGAVFTWAQIVDEQGNPFADESHFYHRIFGQPNRTRHEWLNFFFYNGNALCHPSILIRRQCYDDCGLYRYGLAQLPDFDMWIRLCLKYEIHVMPENLIRYRLRRNEANTSGFRPETRIRTNTEFYQAWKSYLAIASFSELVLIFPGASRYFHVKGCCIEFVFAMICLQEGTFHWARVLAVDLLFDLMRKAETREKLQELYDFSHRDFLKITGENDLFSLEKVALKENQIEQLNLVVVGKEDCIAQLNQAAIDRCNWIEQLNQAFNEKAAQLNQEMERKEQLQHELNSIFHSRGWRFLQKYYKVRDAILPPTSKRRLWVKKLALAASHPGQFLGRLAGNNENAAIGYFAYKPLISIIVPVYNTDESWLRKCIESVVNQSYENWELCIADDASSAQHVKRILGEYAQRDSRVKVVFRAENGHISAASNSALAMAAGEYAGLLDHDDELTPDALYENVKLLNEHPDADMIYSDEDKIDANGRRYEHFFKPDWSPELILGQMYTCHFGLYRMNLLRQIGGFRQGFEGSQDHDLVLRLTEHTGNIYHIPKVLYHWGASEGSAAGDPQAKTYAVESGIKAVAEALERRGLSGSAEPVPGFAGAYKVRCFLQTTPLISIIILSGDEAERLATTLHSIFEITLYPRYEILIVDCGSVEEKNLALYKYWQEREPQRIKIVSQAIPFNGSRWNNEGVRQSNGELLVFLHNDLEILSGEWLAEMAGYAMQPQLGAIGAKLLYPDHTVKHAGVVLGLGGVAGHVHRHFPDSDEGYFRRSLVASNFSAVSGDCLMVRRDIFAAVGGFDESLALSFYDVDFCLRVRDKGWRNVLLPYVRLRQHAITGCGPEDSEEKQRLLRHETDFMKTRWGKSLLNDPFYHSHSL